MNVRSVLKGIVRIAVFALVACAAIAHAGRADQEHEVKAACIGKFIPFIEWPSLGDAGTPFVVGVYGADDYEHTIEDALRGMYVSGHPIVVEQLHSDAEIKTCRVLVSGAASEDRIDRLARLCEKSNTVLIGDSPDFARNGGTIGFVLYQQQVGFEINLDTAKRSGVTISSKLIQLARNKYREDS